MNFSIGDRVRVIGGERIAGMVGTIIPSFTGSILSDRFCIELDKIPEGSRSFGSKRWAVRGGNLTLTSMEPKQNIKKHLLI